MFVLRGVCEGCSSGSWSGPGECSVSVEVLTKLEVQACVCVSWHVRLGFLFLAP